MQPKPPGLSPQHAAHFADPSVAASYPFRLPYPDEVRDVLAGLVAGTPRTVLDIGCGTGDITRPLAPLVDQIDAVDVATTMLAHARTLPGGDDPRIRWLAGAFEDTPLDPPYGLAIAGESLHWLDWERAFPRLRAVLRPHAPLALVSRDHTRVPWWEELAAVIPRYSTNHDFVPYDLLDELARRDLFHAAGQHTAQPVWHAQPIDDYIRGFHSRNGFSLDRMPPRDAAAFDALARQIIAPYARDGQVALAVVATLTWGYP